MLDESLGEASGKREKGGKGGGKGVNTIAMPGDLRYSEPPYFLRD